MDTTLRNFLVNDKSVLTVMLQCETPEEVIRRIRNSLCLGGEAFGLQVENLQLEYHTREVYERIVKEAGDKPTYFTNYRNNYNTGKSDKVLADELVEIAGCGVTLCDVMGDLFDPQPDELSMNSVAIQKQKELINQIHSNGAQVLMSSHVLKFTSPERVLEIAKEHIRRGADISKVVTGASNIDEELENLKIINLLKKELDAPFLFLAQGSSVSISRRLGAKLGNCMTLCVYEHDIHSTIAQPLLTVAKEIRDNLGF